MKFNIREVTASDVATGRRDRDDETLCSFVEAFVLCGLRLWRWNGVKRRLGE